MAFNLKMSITVFKNLKKTSTINKKLLFVQFKITFAPLSCLICKLDEVVHLFWKRTCLSCQDNKVHKEANKYS